MTIIMNDYDEDDYYDGYSDCDDDFFGVKAFGGPRIVDGDNHHSNGAVMMMMMMLLLTTEVVVKSSRLSNGVEEKDLKRRRKDKDKETPCHCVLKPSVDNAK